MWRNRRFHERCCWIMSQNELNTWLRCKFGKYIPAACSPISILCKSSNISSVKSSSSKSAAYSSSANSLSRNRKCQKYFDEKLELGTWLTVNIGRIHCLSSLPVHRLGGLPRTTAWFVPRLSGLVLWSFKFRTASLPFLRSQGFLIHCWQD